MKEAVFIVENKLGLHARPAALFVQTTHKFKCNVSVVRDGQEVDGKSIMGILTLAAEKGAKLTIAADGPDEDALLEQLTQLFKNKFDEE
ncbi:MAG TPA: HPr family phosphocarrier protein [Elusimicrobiota bacterium]|nr:HPr family phosphocarrier protein [Elusimicrobiota bacterium]